MGNTQAKYSQPLYQTMRGEKGRDSKKEAENQKRGPGAERLE